MTQPKRDDRAALREKCQAWLAESWPLDLPAPLVDKVVAFAESLLSEAEDQILALKEHSKCACDYDSPGPCDYHKGIVAKAVREEREACAKIAEGSGWIGRRPSALMVGADIAAAIRGRRP